MRAIGQDWQNRFGRTLLLLPVDQISPNPANPRQTIDERAIDELAGSIRHWGQLQPVVVRRHEDRYQLICGERRWRAHKRAGLDTIWAVERDAADADVLALGLVENLHRLALSPAEKVAALDQLAELVRVTGLRRAAAHLRMDAGWLSRQLAVRRDPAIFPALDAGRIGFGQATELLRAPAQARPTLLQRVLDSRDPVTTAAIRAWVEDARATEPRRRKRATGSAEAGRTPKAPASPYRAVLQQLESLGSPTSAADRVAVRDLIRRACELLDGAGEPVEGADTRLARGARSTSVELKCLLCGELVGSVENGSRLRPRAPGSVRGSGARLVCGRCGGALTPGEHVVHYQT